MLSPMDRSALSRVIVVANGKGGAGKTGVATNIAGLIALAGWRTLFIELDPQGDAGRIFGYYWQDASDEGQSILNASMNPGSALVPHLKNVRPNLDVAPGGARLDDLEGIIQSRAKHGTPDVTLLAKALMPIAGDYDLIVIDTPPTRPLLLQLALTAARWVVVPTRPGRNSIMGLATLARELEHVTGTNPDLEILGAVLFDVETQAKVIRTQAIDDINQVLDGAAPVFTNIIRHASKAAVAAEERGKLVHELADEVENAPPFWEALRAGKPQPQQAGSAPALAQDYLLLAQEILTSIATRESSTTEESA